MVKERERKEEKMEKKRENAHLYLFFSSQGFMFSMCWLIQPSASEGSKHG